MVYPIIQLVVRGKEYLKHEDHDTVQDSSLRNSVVLHCDNKAALSSKDRGPCDDDPHLPSRNLHDVHSDVVHQDSGKHQLYGRHNGASWSDDLYPFYC